MALVERIRAKMPDIVLSTDIIVGFPEETPEDFEETLDLVTKVQYDMAYTFIYSPRVGTPAAKNPNQVPEEEVKEHFGKLVELQNSVDRKKNEAMVGKTVRVLVEDFDPVSEAHFGRSAGDAPDIDGKVYFKAPRRIAPGSMIDVKVREVLDYDLYGRAVMPKE